MCVNFHVGRFLLDARLLAKFKFPTHRPNLGRIRQEKVSQNVSIKLNYHVLITFFISDEKMLRNSALVFHSSKDELVLGINKHTLNLPETCYFNRLEFGFVFVDINNLKINQTKYCSFSLRLDVS